MTRKKRSKTYILNLKDEIHCRIASTDEINSATTSVDESDTKTSVELFPLFQLPHLSRPLEAEFITTEEHKIVSIYGISLNSEDPCFIKNFGYQEIVNYFPKDKRSLLLTNAANIDILRFLCMTMHKISVKFDQIIFIDCIDINNVEMRNEILCKNPKNSVIVLYDISKHNVNFITGIVFHLIGHDSLIIASLMNGEALPFLDEDSQKSLVVVNSSRDLDVHREKRGMEGLAEPFKEQQLSDYEFFLNGEFWTISYKGIPINLNDSIGLQYIHYLLGNPNNEFPVLALVHAIKKAPPTKVVDYQNMDEEQLEGQLIEDGLNKGSTDYLLDEEAIAAYKNHYSKLKSELEEETTPKCKEEINETHEIMEKIVKLLTVGRDKSGKPRKFQDEAEKARKAVSKAVKKSLKKLENEHPALLLHFKSTLKTGMYCSYKPEKSIPWKL